MAEEQEVAWLANVAPLSCHLWIPIFAAPSQIFATSKGRWKAFAGLEKQTVCSEQRSPPSKGQNWDIFDTFGLMSGLDIESYFNIQNWFLHSKLLIFTFHCGTLCHFYTISYIFDTFKAFFGSYPIIKYYLLLLYMSKFFKWSNLLGNLQFF